MESSVTPPDDGSPGRNERLSTPELVLCWAIAVTIFLFVTGPLWRHPWDIAEVDRAILLSYLPIPFLVLGLSAVRRRLGLRGFLLDVTVVTLFKYASTFAIAAFLWESAPLPTSRPAHAHALRKGVDAGHTDAAPTTTVDPARAGSVRGTVVDAAGRPAAGAVAFVSAGLDGYAFTPATGSVELDETGSGFTPRQPFARRGQSLVARTGDGHLHTLVANAGSAVLFNVPVLSSGAPTTVPLGDASGDLTLRCTIHPDREEPAHLLVLAHPLAAIADREGRFELEAVPGGALRVSAWRRGVTGPDTAVDLAPGGRVEITLRLPD